MTTSFTYELKILTARERTEEAEHEAGDRNGCDEGDCDEDDCC